MARKTGPVKKMQTKPAQKRTPFRAPARKKMMPAATAENVQKEADVAALAAGGASEKLQKVLADAGLGSRREMES